jgi:RNA-binding protein 5/10
MAGGVMGVVTQPNMSTFSGFATTGDSDVSPDNVASQFLLLRGLEPGVTEELLAKGVAKLYKAVSGSPAPEAQGQKKIKATTATNDAALGAKEGSLRRVLLVRDRKSNDSWRYGFAEFGSVEDAQAAMAKYNAAEKFTISSKPVMVSYIHAGVFVPVLQAMVEGTEKFAFSPLANPAMKLMYWDEAGYVSELIMPKSASSALAGAKESLKARLATATNQGLIDSVKDADAKNKKRKLEKDASISSKKVVAPHLQFWSNRHAELHGLSVKEQDDQEDTAEPYTPARPEKTPARNPPTQTFADMTRKCCLLCSRKFPTEAEVNKHERVSELHRTNMQDADLVRKAHAKLAKVGITQPEQEGSAYRDRAKERRQAFNQPKQPAAQHKSKAAARAPEPEEEATPQPSKGAALLSKMGWTAGKGLGAEGTGRTEAVTTELYSQGVGLGAQGGKIGDALEEAERSTRNSYSDFVSKAKDKAKERYEGMA